MLVSIAVVVLPIIVLQYY